MSATTTKGAAFSLVAERGRPVVINFFGSWCGPCNMEAPELSAFAAAHAEVTFVGVADDQQAAADAFMNKYALAYPVIADPSGVILSAWGVKGVPTTVFIDRAGVEKARLVGASTRDQFEAALQKALYVVSHAPAREDQTDSGSCRGSLLVPPTPSGGTA